ncbi:hypothetical protein EJ08DRAFT_692549 [Tothia fuscella]|uniref:Uncharacterized protein n=1 Tax=Tothia fuscella TaxID=1048955 RepID=A0A9P4P257_9PEZI|nr:hypothetical protein EJ08DRAFT_692549 [Tothia fuscella]
MDRSPSLINNAAALLDFDHSDLSLLPDLITDSEGRFKVEVDMSSQLPSFAADTGEYGAVPEQIDNNEESDDALVTGLAASALALPSHTQLPLPAPVSLAQPQLQLPADVRDNYSDGNGSRYAIREPLRLFPEKPSPVQVGNTVEYVGGAPILSQITGQPFNHIDVLPTFLDYGEDVKDEMVELWHKWGITREDILARLVNYNEYWAKMNPNNTGKVPDKAATKKHVLNALSMHHQRSRDSIKGGLLLKYVPGKGKFNECVFPNGKLLPMEHLLFGVRIEHQINMNKMTFIDLYGKEWPLFTPKDVSDKALKQLQKDNITPWTLADLHAVYPHLIGYDDKDHPLMTRREQEENAIYNQMVAKANTARAAPAQPTLKIKEHVAKKRVANGTNNQTARKKTTAQMGANLPGVSGPPQGNNTIYTHATCSITCPRPRRPILRHILNWEKREQERELDEQERP